MSRSSDIRLRSALCLIFGMLALPCSHALAVGGESQPLPTPTPTPAMIIAPLIQPTNNDDSVGAEAAENTPPAPTETPAAQPTEEYGEAEEAPTEPAVESPEAENEPVTIPAAEELHEQTDMPVKAPNEPAPATACEKAGCPHVGLDDNGYAVALCAQGERMLGSGAAAADEADEAQAAPVMLTLHDGENTIYQNGKYVLIGGGEYASLNVARGLDVQLSLNGAELLNLALKDDVAATLDFEGQNSIYTIAAPRATLTLDGTGCLSGVKNINSKELNVLGGSVSLPEYAQSANGRSPYVFDAEGATSATVEGKPFPFTCPQDGGSACLWLPTLMDGEYTSLVIDGVLTITSP